MKAIVLFHSICANTYLMAKEYENNLKEQGIEVDLYKVKDDTYEELANQFESSREYKNEILKVKELDDVRQLLEYDLILMGSPTYYGNVSAQIKSVMDKCSVLWVGAKLSGKYFGCFTSSGNSYGGSTQCLQSMNTFAQHMGMILLSVPSTVNNGVECAYGIAHETGNLANVRIGNRTKKSIKEYISVIKNSI